jgi:hypothetical protein
MPKIVEMEGVELPFANYFCGAEPSVVYVITFRFSKCLASLFILSRHTADTSLPFEPLAFQRCQHSKLLPHRVELCVAVYKTATQNRRVREALIDHTDCA